MGGCCCKASSPVVGEGDSTDGNFCPKDTYGEQWWDARSDVSFQSAFSATLGEFDQSLYEGSEQNVDISLPIPNITLNSKQKKAVENAVHHKLNGKIMQARESLLAVAEEAFWMENAKVPAKDVFEEARLVESCYQELHNVEGYHLSREKPMQLYYKHEQGGTTHHLKITATFDHSVSHIVSVAYEWDLLKSWNKFALDPIKFETETPFECIVYGAQWMIPPFKDMQSTLHARGYDLSDEYGCLMILIQDYEQSEEGKPLSLPAKSSKRHTVNFHQGSNIVLRPVFTNNGGKSPKTEAHLTIHVDPHIHGIPASLVNFVLHILAPYLFRQIDSTLKKLFTDTSMQFQARIASQPEVYKELENRVEALRARSLYNSGIG